MNKQVVVMNIVEWIEAFVKHTGLVVEWWATAKRREGILINMWDRKKGADYMQKQCKRVQVVIFCCYKMQVQVWCAICFKFETQFKHDPLLIK